jgi:acylphosphatase
MSVKRVHIYVSGRVQGVNYRRFTQQISRILGLTGWVRNLPDRRVEFVAEGEEENLEELIKRCKEGPTLAIVRDMEVIYEPPTGELDDFIIRY